MLSAPERASLAAFAAALKFTTPVPVPLAPLVIDSQLDWELALQEHRLSAVTVTEPDPPAAWNENDDVERLYVHAGVGVVGLVESHAKQIEHRTTSTRRRIAGDPFASPATRLQRRYPQKPRPGAPRASDQRK